MPLPNRARAVVWKPLVVCPQPDFQRRLQAISHGLESSWVVIDPNEPEPAMRNILAPGKGQR